jgi:general secretion pathway protein H
LIELLVVLVILAATAVVALPMLSSGSSQAELKGATRDVATGLRQARSRAILSRHETLFMLDIETKRYWIEEGDGQGGVLPDAVAIGLLTIDPERRDDAIGGIRFFPDGSSTGGSVTLSADTRAFEVGINWLTGRIAIQEPAS